jgi:transposase
MPIIGAEAGIMKQKKPNQRKSVKLPKHLQNLNPYAAGIDIGSKSHFVAVPEGTDEQPVREFSSFTDDLERLAQWLTACGVTTVAMESTGIYWIPVFEILESYGLEVRLVNARHVKNVPGRKTDMADSKWLAGLLRHGLLRGSFIPPVHVRDWRDLMRMRRGLMEHLGDYKRRVHKVLESANIKLGSVLGDIFCGTGRRLLRLLLERTTEITVTEVEPCLRGRLKHAPEEICIALQGHLRDQHLYMLKKYVQLMESLEAEIAELDSRVQGLMVPYDPVRQRLKAIPGIGDIAANLILAEIGPTLDQFPSSAALASWAGLCPGNNQSAGKRRSGRSPVRRHHLKTIMVEVAWAAIRKKGSYFRDKFYRLRVRLGHKKALIAVAHRLLNAIYHVIKEEQDFRDLGENYLLLRHQARRLAALKRQAKVLGYELTPVASS